MSIFSTYLNRIREDGNLQVVELARICGFDVRSVSRWCMGNRFPSSDEVIDIIINSLQLSYKESLQLEQAYLETAFGKNKYQNYNTIKSLITFLDRESSFITKKEVLGHINRAEDVSLYFKKCNNHIAVLEEIDNIIQNVDTDEKLYFKISDPTLKVLSFLTKQILLSPKRKTEFLFVFSEDDFHNATPIAILLRTSAEIMIHCENVSIRMLNKELDTYFKDENWIFTEKHFLCFDQEIQRGAVTNYPEYIRNQINTYYHLKKNSHEVAQKFDSVLDFPESISKKSHMDIYEFMPCFTSYMDYQLLDKSFYQDIPGREELIQGILSSYHFEDTEKYDVTNLSSEQGLRFFMETGIISIFPYPIYYPFSLEDRIMLLKKLIQSVDNGNCKQLFLKHQEIHNYPVLQIGVFNNENSPMVVLLVIEGNKMNTHRLIFKHPSIIQCVRDYFEVIMHSRFTYTKEESKDILLNILEEYSI